MHRANQGDGAAFLQFLTQVTPRLRGLIRARGRGLPPDLHEDILQEVLLAIHLKRGTWDGTGPVRFWLYAVARHKVVDAFRRRGRRVHLPLDDVAEMLAADPGPAPLAARDADRMLGMIDARSAALVRAVRLEGQSTEDAAARIGVTPGTARVVLHRAMKRLAELAERMK
ncbi:sigma-70 family RNA polymerase sigma factor [Paracoccus hibiscisoli]|uniref:Sigma-70 family RNA polymerase sigma factor n=2 Tax=Paracoccus hibiscisoli TaxID=2023261 RepID=A0A4U0RGK4_9RHOB|nr:sigma-70 family RNA polymerase sigma factor [Paracoccus hibiscisoli]